MTGGGLVDSGPRAHEDAVHDPRVSRQPVGTEAFSEPELYQGFRVAGFDGTILLLCTKLHQQLGQLDIGEVGGVNHTLEGAAPPRCGTQAQRRQF
jgi:hypothetical protein